MNDLLIYTPNLTERVKFTFRFLFSEIIGVEYRITSDKAKFLRYEGPVLNYSQLPLSKGIWIHSQGLLNQTGIKRLNPNPGKWKNLPVLFKMGPEPDMPFDPFAATFFLISRYEEYLDFKQDELGRFPSENSVAYKNDFLDTPVVDIWATRLKNMLRIRYPELIFKEKKYEFISTIDIDQAWAYLHKGILRNLFGGIKYTLKGEFNDVVKRTQTLLGARKDPFDNFEYIANKQQEVNSRYFIQVGKPGKFDKNHSGENRAMRKLISSLAEHNEVGIHPSVRSCLRGELPSEIELLSSITGKKIVKSRQHYLNLRFPKTYKGLLQNGIREDYSMGYPYKPGFRAGTATPFYFYDLGEEKATNLKVYPFQVMDSCLNNNLKLSPDEAMEMIREYILKVKKVNGTFISIWHNSSFSDELEWKGWVEVFDNMLETAKG
ncbi:MAG: polysaccharide deacetylase family protein [Bacteroidales bacterium]|nr:polysaccharide deacetylase family protein [Bacteroidales bacterium]